MERVMCIQCGNIGYTAAPDQVTCAECGGRHKVLTPKESGHRPRKRIKILPVTSLANG